MKASRDQAESIQSFVAKFWYLPLALAALGGFLGWASGREISHQSRWSAEVQLIAPRIGDLKDLASVFTAGHAVSLGPNTRGGLHLEFPSRDLARHAFTEFSDDGLLANGLLAKEVVGDETLGDARVFVRMARDSKQMNIELISSSQDVAEQLMKVLTALNAQRVKSLLNDTDAVLAAVETHLDWAGSSAGPLADWQKLSVNRVKSVRSSIAGLKPENLNGTFYRIISGPVTAKKLEVKSTLFWPVLGSILGLFFGLVGVVCAHVLTRAHFPKGRTYFR